MLQFAIYTNEGSIHLKQAIFNMDEVWRANLFS